MKKISNLLSGVILLLVIISSCNCGKDPELIKRPPSINSFNATNVAMTTADLSFTVSNATNLTLSLNGGVAQTVNGSSYQVTGLTPGTSYTATITAKNSDGSVSKSVSFTTGKSSLVIGTFSYSNVTAKSVQFDFSASSNASITNQTITNTVSGEQIDVTGLTTKVLSNLNSFSNYTFTFTVKDNTGNTVTSSPVTFTTLLQPSSWMGEPQVSYGTQFAIIGNAVSNMMTITINNASGSQKTLSSMVGEFGVNGKAVKMLRYTLNGDNTWKVISANPDGNIAFSNITLRPGLNTFNCYFALRPQVGVPNGSLLSFSIAALNDGEGGQVPTNGSFQAPVAVGTVNANTAPTQLTTEWNGYMALPDYYLVAGSSIRSLFYQVTNIRATGPAGARVASIKLKNPYTAFSGLVFDNNAWALTIGGPEKKVDNFIWQNEYITLTLPNETNLFTDGITYSKYYVKGSYKNTSEDTFRPGVYTPGFFGFALTSKYDLVIMNSDNQVIDLSDATIKQNGIVLTN